MRAGVLIPSLGIALSLGAMIYAYWLFARLMFPVSEKKGRKTQRRSGSLHHGHDYERNEIDDSEKNRPAAFKDDPHSHTIETLSTGRAFRWDRPRSSSRMSGGLFLKCSLMPQQCKCAAHLPFSWLCLVRDLFFAHSPTEGAPQSIREGSRREGSSSTKAFSNSADGGEDSG
jgi:hypothetical protein